MDDEEFEAEIARLTAAGIDVHRKEFSDWDSALEHVRKMLAFDLITQEDFDWIVRASGQGLGSNVIPLRRPGSLRTMGINEAQ